MQTNIAAAFPLAPFIAEPMDAYRAKRSDYLTSHQLIDYAKCPLCVR